MLGHTNELVDLHAIRFDPVLRDRDEPNWIDEFAPRYPGIQSVEHVYFYAVHGADDSTRKAYLERAYHLGKDFVR